MNKKQEIKKDAPEETSQKKGLSAQTIVILIIIALLVILPLSVYLWKQSEISKIRKQHQTELTDIQDKANSIVAESNYNNMITLTRVFSWAVRSELLRNNIEQVNKYMTDLVKAANLNVISIVQTDGIVLLSTNKKYEGNIYPGPIASELSQINEAVGRTVENGEIITLCPIMGLDNRIGTVIISYTPKNPFFKTEPEQK